MTTYGIDRSVVAGGSGSSTTALLADGSTPLTANWDAGNFDITALSFIASGASPTFELIRAVDTQTNTIEFQEADGSVRWKIEHAGSGNDNDFSIKRYNASGVLQDTPLLLDGVTGLVTVPALTVTGDLQYGTVAANTFPRRNTGNTGWEMKTPQQVADELQQLMPKGEVKSLSGSSVDFTDIPSWVTEIDIGFSDVSHNDAGSPTLSVQLGDSGGIETSGYSGTFAVINVGTSASAQFLSSGFYFVGGSLSSQVTSGTMKLVLVDPSTNLWAFSTVGGAHGSAIAYYAGGSKALSATLDRFRISVSSGSFDGGKVSVRYS